MIKLVFSIGLLILVSCSDKNKEEINAGGRDKDLYFKLNVDGQEMEFDTIHYARAGTTIHIATWHSSGFPNLNVTLKTATENDFRASYSYSYDLSPQSSIVLYGIGDGDGFESHWWDCPPQGALLKPSPGAVKIENIERSGSNEIITGSFSAQLYQPVGDCPHQEIRQKNISARFRLRRAQ